MRHNWLSSYTFYYCTLAAYSRSLSLRSARSRCSCFSHNC
jgi:hypothetical protein